MPIRPPAKLRPPGRWRRCVGIGGLALALWGPALAQHAHLDAGLSDLLDRYARVPVPAADLIRGSAPRSNVLETAQRDAAGRVLVDILLDGRSGVDAFAAALTATGAAVTGLNPTFRQGALSAYVPVEQIQAIAALQGLHVMKMTARPQASRANPPAGGVRTLRADVAHARGHLGTGITVGVLSDSYDSAPASFTAVRAADDIASGDLRAPKLVIDRTPAAMNTDEGRAMLQIVHRVAPGAELCFATADLGEAAFAAHIRLLRTHPACRADVIVDDVTYLDEPFYSDGQVAQAVDEVVHSRTLPGKPVAYFSSAGNLGGRAGGGGAIDVPVARFSGRPAGLGNIDLATVAGCAASPQSGNTQADVGGGWLDFGGGRFHTPLTLAGSGTMVMQWDDPFYAGGVTTDLNAYLFDEAGRCVLAFASDNFGTDRPYEHIGVDGRGTFRLMVARTGTGSHRASRVRLLNVGGWSGPALTGVGQPTTFGHSAAASASSVAAYVYTRSAQALRPAIEDFSSAGPVTIAFDAAGRRLPVAEVRRKPDFAAPDGANTTFFPPGPGSDYEGDGWPNFFGTSAAAPHAAGVAALLLHKAGGPGSLKPVQVRSILQSTAPARVLPYAAAPAVQGWNAYDGYGLIDALLALARLR